MLASAGACDVTESMAPSFLARRFSAMSGFPLQSAAIFSISIRMEDGFAISIPPSLPNSNSKIWDVVSPGSLR